MSKELRHDRHTVSLLTDHMVITPKYRGKILVGEVGLVTEVIIRKTCKEMDIKIIDISVNIDHVHLFIQYPPKYCRKFYCKEDQRTIKQNIETALPTSQRNVQGSSLGTWVLSRISWTGMGCS